MATAFLSDGSASGCGEFYHRDRHSLEKKGEILGKEPGAGVTITSCRAIQRFIAGHVVPRLG